MMLLRLDRLTCGLAARIGGRFFDGVGVVVTKFGDDVGLTLRKRRLLNRLGRLFARRIGLRLADLLHELRLLLNHRKRT